MPETFRAYRVEETGDGGYRRSVRDISIDDLPANDVLVRVHWSSLNYKDALSATGNKGVTRKFPHTPGIDAAGVVSESDSPDWRPGDRVIVTSYDLGMNTDGGLGQYIRVPGDWIVPCPESLTLRDAMALGTAGLTAALCVDALRARAVKADAGEVLVTGASGGVGSLAVGILARLGYRVVAVSGKPDVVDWLRSLGAADVVGRDVLQDDSGRPLLKAHWAGVVDTVGGDILAAALKSVAPGGTVACCGLVASPVLNTTVLPFILRGVALIGIDSQNAPMTDRRVMWERLASDWRPVALESLTSEITLDGVDEVVEALLAGGARGRTVVAVTPE